MEAKLAAVPQVSNREQDIYIDVCIFIFQLLHAPSIRIIGLDVVFNWTSFSPCLLHLHLALMTNLSRLPLGLQLCAVTAKWPSACTAWRLSRRRIGRMPRPATRATPSTTTPRDSASTRCCSPARVRLILSLVLFSCRLFFFVRLVDTAAFK